MKPADLARWQSEVLDEVFVALASPAELKGLLVYKGARVLAHHLSLRRQSLDIDANISASFGKEHPGRDEQKKLLERTISTAVRKEFESQQVVVRQLNGCEVVKRPDADDPRGWNMFEIRLHISSLLGRDRQSRVVTIDVSAYEPLIYPTVEIQLKPGKTVHAQSLERIAGEKLRAFLSSLRTHRDKIGRRLEAVRAKDLYDLTSIRRSHLANRTADFWPRVAREFEAACSSRLVDCVGLESFTTEWDTTRKAYGDNTIPKDISFDEASSNLAEVVKLVSETIRFPLRYPMP